MPEGSHVEKDLTLYCVVQEVAGQHLPALHEMFPLVPGHFEACRVLRERLWRHDVLQHVVQSTRVGSVSLHQ